MMQTAWRVVGEDVLLRVRAHAGARRSGIGGLRATARGVALEVAVVQPARAGKANHAIVRELARALALPRSSIEVVRGASGRDKVVRLAGAAPGALARLRALT